MRFAYPCPKLNSVDYPDQLLAAAKGFGPSSEASIKDALEVAVEISIASSAVSRKFDEQTTLYNGPFGAVRLAVKRIEFYRYLQFLQGSSSSPKDIAEKLYSISGTIVGLGWNSVNCAHLESRACVADPTAHAEMQAIRAASKALGIPMGQWREKNLCCIEVASAQNCDMCRATNDLWAGTALSVYAAPRETISKVGFNETSENSSDPGAGLEWGHIAWDQSNVKCTQVWAGLCDSQIANKAQKALQTFKDTCKALYQPDQMVL